MNKYFMKAKFVNETFEKGKKPVGMDSQEGIDQLLNRFEKKGIKIGWQLRDPKEGNKREFFGEYHNYIEKYLEKLNKAGVEWKNMTLWGDHVDVQSYQIMKGNWSLFHCLTREDAEMLINILENIATGNQSYNISEDKENINLSDKIHIETDPEHKKWIENYEKRKGEKRRTDLDFLDKIEETRKKLKTIQ